MRFSHHFIIFSRHFNHHFPILSTILYILSTIKPSFWPLPALQDGKEKRKGLLFSQVLGLLKLREGTKNGWRWCTFLGQKSGDAGEKTWTKWWKRWACWGKLADNCHFAKLSCNHGYLLIFEVGLLRKTTINKNFMYLNRQMGCVPFFITTWTCKWSRHKRELPCSVKICHTLGTNQQIPPGRLHSQIGSEATFNFHGYSWKNYEKLVSKNIGCMATNLLFYPHVLWFLEYFPTKPPSHVPSPGWSGAAQRPHPRLCSPPTNLSFWTQNPLAGKGTNRFMSPEKKMPIYINSTHPFKVNCKNQPNHTEAVNWWI